MAVLRYMITSLILMISLSYSQWQVAPTPVNYLNVKDSVRVRDGSITLQDTTEHYYIGLSYQNSTWGMGRDGSGGFSISRMYGGTLSPKLVVYRNGYLGIGIQVPLYIIHAKYNQAGYTYMLIDNSYTPALGVGSGVASGENGNIKQGFRFESDNTGTMTIFNAGNGPMTFKFGTSMSNISEKFSISINGDTNQSGYLKLRSNGAQIDSAKVVGSDLIFYVGGISYKAAR